MSELLEEDREELWSAPLLDTPQLRALETRRLAMGEVNTDLIAGGDVELILKDPSWNPRRRTLSAEDREELEDWILKCRFYSTVAPRLRFKKAIKPEVARLRETKAYVEYPSHESPPSSPQILLSHAEPSEVPETRRIYYFEPARYPEWYRQLKVEAQRGLEAFVEAYAVING